MVEYWVCNIVDGGWTEWEEEYSCTASCGKGVESFTRSCTNPEPKCGGKECDGSSTLSKECDTQKPCPRKLTNNIYVAIFIIYEAHALPYVCIHTT